MPGPAAPTTTAPTGGDPHAPPTPRFACAHAAAALSITEERRTVMDLSDPCYDNEVGLVTDGEDGIGSIDRIVETWIPVQEN